MRGHDARRYVAPAAFLLAVTIAVILVRSGLESGSHGGGTGRQAVPPPPAKSVASHTTAVGRTTTSRSGRRYWVVRAGDTFGVISTRTGVPVATLARLNPNVKSTSLHIGEKVRLR